MQRYHCKIREEKTRFFGHGEKKSKTRLKIEGSGLCRGLPDALRCIWRRLEGFDAPQLGALAIKECLRRTGGKVKGEDIDYVIMGQVVPAGCGQVPSRSGHPAGWFAGKRPSITVNKVCSSGIQTIDLAVQMIQTGRAEIVIAGGQESMSNCPYSLPDMRWGNRMGTPERTFGRLDGFTTGFGRLLQPPHGHSRFRNGR